MSMIQSTTSIVCFGEILWDVFDDSMKPGGAPLNVTYHLRRLGIDSEIISRVGLDEPGRALLALMKGWGISTDFCQLDAEHETSRVQAKMDEQHEVTYEILQPVAWDFIESEDRYAHAVAQADVLVFGSLVMRNGLSCETLFQLLNHANYCVFDVNLRDPFYGQDLIFKALEKTDLLKVNQQELDIIAAWVDASVKEEASKIALIHRKFQINEILLTKGSQGAAYFKYDQKYDQKFEIPGCDITVADTVGSGDAFLAAFLVEKFSKESTVESQLSMASLLGAFVATKQGACPAYDAHDLQEFKQHHILVTKNHSIC